MGVLIDFIKKILSFFIKKDEISVDEMVDEVEKKHIEEVTEPMKQYTVIIDPGHGGKDSGAVGEYSEEKALNLIFSNKLYDLLEQDYHFVPVLTRNRDEYHNLKYRVDLAKESSADIFISMHCNASVLNKPHDCQIYYHSDSKDKQLAEILFSHVDKIDHDTSKWSREIKANFYVLRNLVNTSISAVLVEVGFISNAKDEQLLNDEDFQNMFCEGLYNGIKNFFNV
jgi:N-acetylmuramoyl-L-alanine amidase